MKIVVNRCYGGFGLSPQAMRRVADLMGKECYFFESVIVNMSHRYQAVDQNEAGQVFSWCAFTVPNPTSVACDYEDWGKMSQEERIACNERWDTISLPNFRSDRTNPILVQVVEELGEKASGRFAKLEVVEIPDELEWEIEEYDGNEWISESHRTW